LVLIVVIVGHRRPFTAERREKSSAATKIAGERPLTVATQNTFPNP